MPRRDAIWKKINKCVVCGTKLQFLGSTLEGAKEPEGEKFCETNHVRFSVYGFYDTSDNWVMNFIVRQK